MLRYYAAEQLALAVLLQPADDVDAAMSTWASDYARRYGRSPETAERDAARRVLTQRLGGEAPPLPPSTSGVWPREPGLLFVLIDGEDA